MINLGFLHSLEVAQKFVMEEAKDYLVAKVMLVLALSRDPSWTETWAHKMVK